MRTFVRKPKTTAKTTFARPAIPRAGFSGQGREPYSILHLQRSVGNRAVQRLLQENHAEGPTPPATTASTRFVHKLLEMPLAPNGRTKIQPGLAIGPASDAYEHEADRVAHQVIGLPVPRRHPACACAGKNPEFSVKQARQESEPVQAGSIQTNEPGVILAPPVVRNVLNQPGHPLDRGTRNFMESRFGHDFSQVRVHTDAQAAASARAVNALAYTVGRDIVFAEGRYTPGAQEGRRLLAHELAHVVQQGGKQARIQRQPAPSISPATANDRREFVQLTIDFLSASARYFRDQHVSINRALFERVINNWYLIAIDRERVIDRELGGDVALKNALRTAYIAAIRVLISRAARAFGKSENDLYRENSGRIPMWAWRTPHRLEPGFSTPIAQGRSVDVQSGNVTFSTHGFDVTIVPDATDSSLGNQAETRIHLNWNTPAYQWQSQGGQKIITSFTPPPPVRVRIQTFYGPGVTAASPSAYGRGTTPEDIAGGRVTPESTTLRFHEGSHGLAFIEFLESHPAPQFTGQIGMTEAQFLAAIAQWKTELKQYSQRINDFSTRHTDCVGTTIDQYHQPAHGTATTIVCPP